MSDNSRRPEDENIVDGIKNTARQVKDTAKEGTETVKQVMQEDKEIAENTFDKIKRAVTDLFSGNKEDDDKDNRKGPRRN